jgi:ATP-binding cassette, subfamily B, bacterial MsbA
MKNYNAILKYLSAYKGKIVLYFLFTILSIVFGLATLGMLFPFLQVLFDKASALPVKAANVGFSPLLWLKQQVAAIIGSAPPLASLSIICLLIIASIVLKNLFLYLSVRTMVPVKSKVSTSFKIELFNKVLSLPIGYFTEQRKGDVMQRMMGDVGQVEASVLGALEAWIKDPLQIIITLIILFTTNFQLTLAVLIFLPVIGFFIGRIGRSLKANSKDFAEHSGDSIAILDESLGGLRIIKAFNNESRTKKRFADNANYLMKLANKMTFRQALASPTSEVLGVIIFTALLWYGGSQVLGEASKNNTGMDGAMFLAFMATFYNIIDPAKSISASFANLQRGNAAIGRINEILQAPVTVDDNEDGEILETFKESIEFKNVNFFYEDAQILKNINFKLEKGKMVALVGSSGAGKSTLADLVPRFHDVTSGEVLVDGKNIKSYNLNSVRKQIGIVTQEPILFWGSIADNIELGKFGASAKEIEDAAKIANAHSYIIKKEEGYNTNIGDRGSRLSGGERQRLTIARAVLKNPPILVLDEATSSLDTESEKLVQDAIYNLMENRTSLVIAHRLSTIKHADEILVMQKGEIVERGTHEQLIAQNGFYKRLVDLQEVK